MAVLGQDAFRVELHAVDRPCLVVQGHDFAILGEGVGYQNFRQVFGLHRQRMVSHHLIGFGQTFEKVPSGLANL